MVLRLGYAMSSTDIGYGATRKRRTFSARTTATSSRYTAREGPCPAYAPTRVLRDVRYCDRLCDMQYWFTVLRYAESYAILTSAKGSTAVPAYALCAVLRCAVRQAVPVLRYAMMLPGKAVRA
eukprot:1763252-Rhodomonas_salina.2